VLAPRPGPGGSAAFTGGGWVLTANRALEQSGDLRPAAPIDLPDVVQLADR